MKILCVCMGNICRSPMAEGILRKVASDNQLDWHVESASTSGYHEGDTPDRRSVILARDNDIEISQLRARKFVVEDFEIYDWVLVMDRDNLRDVLGLSPNEVSSRKVKMFRHDGMDVQDPYYGGEKDFQVMYDVLFKHALIWKDTLSELS